jgi:hypothetical protein
MTTTATPPTFSFTHNRWGALTPERLGERATVRHLHGGSSDAWWLELASGARLSASGLPAEACLTVCSGRITCLVLGNVVELPAEHFALLPPQLPFELRVTSRSPAAALLHCACRTSARLLEEC